MEALVLYYRGEPVRELVLGTRPLAIGGAPHCDLVLSGVADREILVRAVGGTVVAYDLRKPGRAAGPVVVPRDTPLPLGRDHSMVRVDAPTPLPTDGLTERLAPPSATSPLTLVVGGGRDARRAVLRDRVFTIGSLDGNDLVLRDRAVSAHHCRLDPTASGYLLRDLGSRNGTYVDGFRVEVAELAAGATLRIGRTEVHVLGREDASSAPRDSKNALVAESSSMLGLLHEIDRVAKLTYPVLLVGESGVGKEGLAARVHAKSPRASGPFVALNAGGLPPQLVESELFGHEKGAFTGAVAAHRGVFEQAHGGTLFLDEIGELPLDLQSRLLRVLETWELRRVGSETSLRVDTRLVCATHRDLRTMVAEGTFRRDLYYRLCTLVLDVPPLRERKDDILPIARALLSRMRDELGERSLDRDAEARLLTHPWEGNVRELRNVLLVAAASTTSESLDGDALDRAIARVSGTARALPDAATLGSLVDDHGGNIASAARALGIARTTLRDRLRRSRPEDAPGG